MIEPADAIGMVAGTLTTLAFLPQVVKTWKSRSTRDISLTMFLAFTAGVGLWLVYGILIEAWPVILSNLVTLLLAGIILFLKLRHLKDEP